MLKGKCIAVVQGCRHLAFLRERESVCVMCAFFGDAMYGMIGIALILTLEFYELRIVGS